MNPVSVNAGNATEVSKLIRDGAIVGPSTVRRSPSIAKLASALCSVQGEVKNPTKNKQNPHLKNWYADLTAVLAVVLPTFSKHKLAVTQLPCELDGEPAMQTLLLHESGEWVETVTKIRPTKTDPQSVGSAQSYARRYALQCLAGIAAEDDDDGNAASHPAQQPKQQGTPYPQKPADEVVDAKAVARFVGLLAKCDSKQDYQNVCEQIAAGVQSGAINAATREALRKPAQDTLARVSGQPVKA